VGFIHERDIVHRDLKPDNFLFSWDPKDVNQILELKLTDFDLSDYIKNDPFNLPCGSPAYAAPEVCIMNPIYHGRKTDVWSIGILLHLLVCGAFPWFDQDMLKLFEMIRFEPLDLPLYLSYEVKDLLQKILTKNPEERITLPQISSHSWLSSQR